MKRHVQTKFLLDDRHQHVDAAIDYLLKPADADDIVSALLAPGDWWAITTGLIMRIRWPLQTREEIAAVPLGQLWTGDKKPLASPSPDGSAVARDASKTTSERS